MISRSSSFAFAVLAALPVSLAGCSSAPGETTGEVGSNLYVPRCTVDQDMVCSNEGIGGKLARYGAPTASRRRSSSGLISSWRSL